MEEKKPRIDGAEKRRFERVRLPRSLAGALAPLGAQVNWPNHEVSEVIDLSYKGFAARRPGLFPLAAQQEALALHLQLGTLPPFAVRARPAWCTHEAVGLEVAELSAEGHARLGLFLDAKLLGTRLRPVESAFIGPQETFTRWFQGPQDTHVFVWREPSTGVGIARVVVSMGGIEHEFVRGQPVTVRAGPQLKALLVLSQMDKDGLGMEEFVRSLGASSGD